ncbi:MerR family transcriptional regulator [Actinoplanes couchii]|uniref:MerR family transcriptional regulator n=1 Tax=Actinoplanes couchii TaxID=403638 RepID=A0ABQ3XU95_9ACTN|nr:MerR family transcriptional regulator [Actinoplanes couchii]MDR6317355.1 DNA-binding transcriptional MerR regulator [Actinoplanes couchii]GID62028.1 MerR family transcriptional regulator [Actinoplanes couchii]
MTGLRSGQVAAAAGVNPQTLRYYERRGLLPQPDRTLGGHRLYPAETISLLRLIKASQRLGFTLDEVTALLNARGAGMHARAAAKLSEVELKIAELTMIAEALRGAVAASCDDVNTCAADPRCPLPDS